MTQGSLKSTEVSLPVQDTSKNGTRVKQSTSLLPACAIMDDNLYNLFVSQRPHPQNRNKTSFCLIEDFKQFPINTKYLINKHQLFILMVLFIYRYPGLSNPNISYSWPFFFFFTITVIQFSKVYTQSGTAESYRKYIFNFAK